MLPGAMLLKIFIVGCLGTNTILLVSEETKQAAAIDPAFGATEKILPYLKKNNLNLKAILLTHSHWDHIGDVKELKEKTGAPIYIHKLDCHNLNNPGSDKIPSFEKFEEQKKITK
jgi:glyoxylase-like metal-dependent hydrolase (beta-lactamase superfamily II)